MATRTKVKGGSNKKKGRNISKCSAYKAKNVRLANKRRKVERHIANNPNDRDAVISV